MKAHGTEQNAHRTPFSLTKNLRISYVEIQQSSEHSPKELHVASVCVPWGQDREPSLFLPEPAVHEAHHPSACHTCTMGNLTLLLLLPWPQKL